MGKMTAKAKRFVIAEHSTPHGVHWDLMLEIDDKLQTYRLDKHPQEIFNGPVNAEKIFDHPLKFLTYEGPVNNNQGMVRLVESGKYNIQFQKPDSMQLIFEGQILKGLFALTKINENIWQFSKTKADNDNIV